MKTTVVPAQITTVEDRIAGNFTIVQVILLVISLIIGAAIYSVLTPKLHFNTVKSVLMVLQFGLFAVLAFRIKGKIVADWLIILARYQVRPRRYIFTKNDPIYRDVVVKRVESEIVSEKEPIDQNAEPDKPLPLLEQIKIDRLFQNSSMSVSFKLHRKGGVDVSLKQVEN